MSENTPRYDLLALDLDGTLVGTDGRVSRANVDAIDRARDAGIEVVICTGRAYAEMGHAIDAIRAHVPAQGRDVAPVVASGGSTVVDAATGNTLHAHTLDAELVRALCERFAHHERAPLLLKDAHATGTDYLVVRSGPVEDVSKWWFEHMGLRVRYVDHIDHDEHPDSTIRVGFAAENAVMEALAQDLMREFEGRAFMQSFPAVTGTYLSKNDPVPSSATPKGVESAAASSPGATAGGMGSPSKSVRLLEVFHLEVNKWVGIQALAGEQAIPPERICAIGDEINDLAMIENAGLGIAMENAVPEIKAAASRQTRSNAEDGVAHAIEHILAGDW